MHFRYKSILHLPPYHWARLQASRLTCQIGQPITDAFPLQDVGPLDASFQKRFFTWKQPQGMQPSWLRKKNSKLELTGFVTQQVKKHAIYLEIHSNSANQSDTVGNFSGGLRQSTSHIIIRCLSAYFGFLRQSRDGGGSTSTQRLHIEITFGHSGSLLMSIIFLPSTNAKKQKTKKIRVSSSAPTDCKAGPCLWKNCAEVPKSPS